MNNPHLIKKAILSEKTHKQMENGLYTFLVPTAATKSEIAKAVEKQFQVTVKGVNVLSKPSKTKRIAGTRKKTSILGGKKAIVLLQKGQSIALFSTKKEKTKVKKTETKEKSTAAKSSEGKDNKGLLSRFRKQKEEKQEK